MVRQHKIAILKYTTRNFWLLLIPLLRGLVSMKFDFYHWIKGAYLDIIVIGVIFGLAMLRWHFIRFEVKENEIFVSSGVFARQEYVLPYSCISCASAKRLFWFRPLKAVTVTLDSDSCVVPKKRCKADVELIMNLNEYTKLYNKIPNELTKMKLSYEASRSNLVLFSVLFSSTLSGVIFIGTFFIQGGRILDRKFEHRLLTAVDEFTKIIQGNFGSVTPISVAVTLVIVLGWLVSFVSNLLRHINFRVVRKGKNVLVENGLFSLWKYYVNISKVNCADLRQNLLMKICRVMSVHVNCTGYGKKRNEIPVFVPITTRKRVLSSMQQLLPEFTMSNITLKPRKMYFMAFLWVPLVMSTVIPAIGAVAIEIFPEWQGAIKFFALMAEIPSVYLLIVKFVSKFTTGVGIEANTITLKYCKNFYFHTIVVPKSRVAYVRLRQTFFQRRKGCCDVWVYTRGERAARHRVRGIALDEAEKFAADYE